MATRFDTDKRPCSFVTRSFVKSKGLMANQPCSVGTLLSVFYVLQVTQIIVNQVGMVTNFQAERDEVGTALWSHVHVLVVVVVIVDPPP